MITAEAWNFYNTHGYLKLGPVLNSADLAALRQRIDDIMLGKASTDPNLLLMQLDSDTGKYEDAGVQSRGHKGATLGYRKIQDLEFDPLFLEYLQQPIFREICDHIYAPGAAISCFRAMFMNKPAHRGTFLPWHQDRWTHLSQDPLITLWTALDPATRANGCVQIIPGSHRDGLINPSHGAGFLTRDQALEHAPTDKVEYLELAAGEAALLHNHLLHASDVNKTDIPRRAFSVCYMPATTLASNGEIYNVVFGPGAMEPRATATQPA